MENGKYILHICIQNNNVLIEHGGMSHVLPPAVHLDLFTHCTCRQKCYYGMEMENVSYINVFQGSVLLEILYDGFPIFLPQKWVKKAYKLA